MTKTGFLICFLFIVNKAFAQADNFYYTSYNKIDSMLTGKKS